jgi:hypothetical protein
MKALKLPSLFFTLILLLPLISTAATPFRSDLVITYEVRDGAFLELVPFYSYSKAPEGESASIVFRAPNMQLSYNQEQQSLFLIVDQGQPIKLADVELPGSEDRLFPHVVVPAGLTINSVQKKEGRKFKVTVCSAIHIPLPFFPACRRVKVRAYSELTEVETSYGEHFCSKYIRDYRSEMHGEDKPTSMKFYQGRCKKEYLTDERFIYRRPRK